MYCQNCGKQVVDGAKFCTNCGTAVNEAAENAPEVSRPNPFTEYDSNGNQNSEKKSVLSVIRGVPFLLLFLAFFLPLIVVSCPVVNKDIAEFSVYQSADLVQSASNVLSSLNDFSYDSDTAFKIEELNNDAATVKVMAYVLFALASLAFLFSFRKRIFAAILGILGLVDLVIMTLGLCGITKDPSMIGVSPSVGFYLSALLFVAGIVMNFIPCTDKSSDHSEFNTKVILIAVFAVLGLGGIAFLVPMLKDAMISTVKIGSQTWMAKDICNGSNCTYSWDEARNVCPKGYHLPSTKEWSMVMYYARASEKNTEFITKIFLPEDFENGAHKSYDDLEDPQCTHYSDWKSPIFWTSSNKIQSAGSVYEAEGMIGLGCTKKTAKLRVRCIKG